jgi:hypothetical protein
MFAFLLYVDEELDNENLLAYLKNQHRMHAQIAGVSGGAVEFLEGMAPKQRQSSFLLQHGGSFARKSKLSIIEGDLNGRKARPSFSQNVVETSQAQNDRPRKASLSSSDERYQRVDDNDGSEEKSHHFDGQAISPKSTNSKLRSRQPTIFAGAEGQK